MVSHANNPYSKTYISIPEGQTSRIPRPQNLENIGPGIESISYIVSKEEVNVFRHITPAYARRVGALPIKLPFSSSVKKFY
jgi:hypothetical protein